MAHTYERLGDIEWGVGELEWEAWMRQLDGAVIIDKRGETVLRSL